MSRPGASRALTGLLLALIPLSLPAACGGSDREAAERNRRESPAVEVPRFDGSAAYRLVRRQVEFGPRAPGRPGHARMADWLEEYLAARADSVIVQRFQHVTVDGDTLPLVNFLARFRAPGERPLLLLSHWDTRPVSDQALSREEREQPVPGANDGASGTAVLLQLAEMLQEAPPPAPVDLLLVDGEDYGDFAGGEDVFLGSRYFAEHQPTGYDPRYGILLDMVGDRDLEIYVEGHSNRLAPEVVDRVWNAAHRLGFRDVFHREVRHTVNDDHIPLNDAGIPTINVIDFDYPFWHTPADTPDKVSASSLGAVGQVMARVIYMAEPR